MKTTILSAVLLAAITTTASAQDEQAATWKGTGELGFVSSSGNARSDSVNGKLGMQYEDEQWKHQFHVAGFRQRGEVIVLADPNDPSSGQGRLQLNANRLEVGGSTARKLDDRNSLYTSLRYEDDEFAAYDWQATLSVGWGHQAIQTDTTKLYFEVGPGYRRIKDAVTGQIDGDFVARGRVDFEKQITASTSVVDTLLVEAGSDNTFIQNDLGLKVAINDAFAVKAGFQIRHNTDAPVGREKTDRLTTLNLVYDF